MTGQLPRLYTRLPRSAEFIVRDPSSYYLRPAHPGLPLHPSRPNLLLPRTRRLQDFRF